MFDEESGRRRKVWALVFTAAYSRHSFVWLSFSQTLVTVIAGFEEAWAFFGGVFAVVIPDNMATIVTSANACDPTFNHGFVEYAPSRNVSAQPRVPVPAAHVIYGHPRHPHTPQALPAVEAQRQPRAGRTIRDRRHRMGTEQHPGAVRAERTQCHPGGELITYRARYGLGIGAGEGCHHVDAARSTLAGKQPDGVSDPLRVRLRQADTSEEVSRLVEHDQGWPHRHHPLRQIEPVVAAIEPEVALAVLEVLDHIGEDVGRPEEPVHLDVVAGG